MSTLVQVLIRVDPGHRADLIWAGELCTELGLSFSQCPGPVLAQHDTREGSDLLAAVLMKPSPALSARFLLIISGSFLALH